MYMELYNSILLLCFVMMYIVIGKVYGSSFRNYFY